MQDVVKIAIATQGEKMKFMDFIRSQKEHPKEHWRDDQMWWNFWSLTPESIHQVLWLMGS